MGSRPNLDGGSNPPDPGGGGGTPKKSGPLGGVPSLITSTGGLFGFNNALLVPFFDTRSGLSYFVMYDPTNFNCEEDCVYNFRLESGAPSKEIDVTKIFLEYRDLGPVTFTIIVTATQYNKALRKEKVVRKEVSVSVGTKKADNKIHSYYVDLKLVGERPQLSIFRAADAGPLSIIRAMMFINTGEAPEGEGL